MKYGLDMQLKNIFEDEECRAAFDQILPASDPHVDDANTGIADYVILPIDWTDGTPKIRWTDSWRLEDYE